MADFILIDGDKANFNPTFTPATVTVKPGDLKGSGKSRLNSKKVCVDGDEKNVSVSGCMYLTPIYSIPGTGTLKIGALGGDQKRSKASTAKGKYFHSLF